MTDNRKKLILPIVIVAGALAIAAGLVMTRPVAAREEAAVIAPLVRAVEVELGSVELRVRTQGTLAPLRESDLVAQVAGRIAEVSPKFGAGGELAAGEMIARIDPRDYELAVQQAKASRAQASVRLQREEAEAALAREEWIEIGGEASPLALRVPQLAEAAAAVEAADASVARAELDLERTVIRAPFAGRIAAKMADLGQFVAPGTPVARIFSTAYAEIELRINPEDEAYLDFAALGTAGSIPVEFEAKLGGDVARWTGRVVRTTGRVDERTRMSGLIARVDAPYAIRSREGQPLQMGQFVEADVIGRTVDGVARLPRSAVRGASRVIVIDGERKLRFREVDVLRLTRDEALIRAGLANGELVLVSPMEAPVEGMTVQVASRDDGAVSDGLGAERAR